ncbi:hypothetical protein [Pedobacter sp. GR22-6]|uniref:hypothetical protein n=1 Tax=Pedobacter sp. GR22-6 TaxID=3127957 RepID=UPI00307EFA40
MFGLFKRKVKESEAVQNHDREYEFTWHELGEHNPFNTRILDIRNFTQHMLAFTEDKSVAETFNQQRHSIGQELIGIKMPESKAINVMLVYPHDGSKIEGAAYKAKCMEDKWDIYGWDNTIYFTRSWTGEVVYRAFINITDTNFAIQKIEYIPDQYNADDQSLVVNNVHFLIKTLAFGSIYPHKVPANLINQKDIALYSFNQFGHNCWYATYNDILDVTVNTKS